MSFFDDHIIISDMSSMFGTRHVRKSERKHTKKEGNKLSDDKSIMKEHLSTDNKIESSLAMKQ